VSSAAFLLSLVVIQAALVCCDLLDRHLTRKQRYGGEPLRLEGLLFLLAVLVVFYAVQFGGFALVPASAEMMAGVRVLFAERFRLPMAQDGATWWTLGAVAVLAYYLAGLWDYLIHRFFSHSRWFFFTHEYHHLPNQVFVTMPGLAARPFAVIAVFPVVVATIVSTYATLGLLGFPLWDLEALKVVVLVQVTVNTATHSCFLRRFWWIHHLVRTFAITTPQEHVLHHTVDLDGNYGNFTTLWDRVFGTYLDPASEQNKGHRLGLSYDQDFLGTLTLGLLKLPRRWRRRWQVSRYCNLNDVAPEGSDYALSHSSRRM
jgi:sterol desaturase/sphingolipid hydroxylase (fatty acid hydroxylase superfamily)